MDYADLASRAGDFDRAHHQALLVLELGADPMAKGDRPQPRVWAGVGLLLGGRRRLAWIEDPGRHALPDIGTAFAIAVYAALGS